MLVRSAFSANIKERRDCSTALFDERGRMVAQAEHIPVHLGAMPEAVAAVRAHDPTPGEPWILNDPYAGGTHLPDITLVSRTALGYAVTRAHHADVGGTRARRACPPISRDARRGGRRHPADAARRRGARARSSSRMRNPDERRGDLRAQLAAHRLAERRVAELCARRGHDRVAAAMDELYAYSERSVRAGDRRPPGRALRGDATSSRRVDGDARAPRGRDDRGRRASRSTSPARRRSTTGNLNCPLAVTRSACFFVVRCLTDPDLPASGGAFAPVTRHAPEGCLVNARPPAAVAAGNVETSSAGSSTSSSRAFGEAVHVPAQGQGTMNNVTLGNERFTYYETIGGGQGACPDADGPSGVHVAMSNTLSTRRSRRSSSRIRCASSATRCGSARAARDAPRRRRRRARAARARGLPALDHQRSAGRTRRKANEGESPEPRGAML